MMIGHSASAAWRHCAAARSTAATSAARHAWREPATRAHPHRSASTSTFSSASCPASAALPSTPAIAFDIDGVLLRGRSLLPTAVAALRKVTRRADGGDHPGPAGIPHVYLTNGGGVTEEAKAAQLSKLFGLRIPAEAVVLSHTPMRQLVPLYRDRLVLTLGMTDVRSVARSYGFKHLLIPEDLMAKYPEMVPHITHGGVPKLKEAPVSHYEDELNQVAAIMVLHDPVEWYRDLQITLDLLVHKRASGMAPPSLYFSNPDFLFSGRSTSPRLAAGAFRVCLAALYKEYTGKQLQYTLFGKPNAVTYQYAEKLLREQAGAGGMRVSHIYGIGDNPAADILGANSAGSHWSSVLVRSGTIPKSIHPDEQPHFEVECVDAAIDLILAGGAHAQKN